MDKQSTCQMYLELAEKALHISREMNEMFSDFMKLFECECEMIREMELNRKIQIESDNMPF